MKKQQLCAATLSLALVFSVFSGCQPAPAVSSSEGSKPADSSKAAASAAEREAPAEAVPMRYYMPGAPTPESEKATAAINEKLAADKVPVVFTPMYIPWDQWTNKINLMLSAGDEFELLHIMEDYVPTYVYVARAGLTPLDELIDQYTPELREKFDDVLWKCATVGDAIYTVPAYWRDNSGDGEGNLNFRSDKFEEFNLKIPTTLDEILETLPILQEKWKEQDGETRYVYEHSVNRCPVALHRTYDTWPFYASQDGLFQVFQDGTAAMYFTSEEFKKDCDFLNKLYTAGLTHPDILNLPADTRRTALDYGDYLMGIMTGATETTLVTNGVKEAKVYTKPLNPDLPYLRNLPLLNSNAIPVTAKKPQAGLQFLNWMYSSKENQDLVLYGVEGTHWNPVGEDKYEQIRGTDSKPLYAFDAWMIEYVPFHRFNKEDVSSEEEKQDYITNIHPDNTVDSVMVGFNFNSDPVKVEYANVQSEYTTSMLPIKEGVVSYADGYADALAKMKAAGYEAVIAEYQKQLTAYIASQK